MAANVLLALALLGIAEVADGAEMSGKEVFEHYCSYCHGSPEGPGSVQLGRTRGADKALLTQRTDLKAKYVEYVVRHGLKSMPAFVPSDLTETRLQALAAFLAK
jgi:mono/diheme cytochrome c family protein